MENKETAQIENQNSQSENSEAVDNGEKEMLVSLYNSIKPNESVCLTAAAIVLWTLAFVAIVIFAAMNVSITTLLTVVGVCITAAILGVFLFVQGKMIKVQTAMLYKLNSVLKELRKNNQ